LSHAASLQPPPACRLAATTLLVDRGGVLGTVAHDVDGDGLTDLLALATQGRNELIWLRQRPNASGQGGQQGSDVATFEARRLWERPPGHSNDPWSVSDPWSVCSADQVSSFVRCLFFRRLRFYFEPLTFLAPDL
jgi:hypothetical protein